MLRAEHDPLGGSEHMFVTLVAVPTLQGSLFGDGEPAVDPHPTVDVIPLDRRSSVEVVRSWLLGADTLFERLLTRLPWRRHRRVMYDRLVEDPRLSCWVSPDEPAPDPMIPTLRTALERHYRVPLGGMAANYYRDGRDSIAFHRDRELADLDDALVAILTLGALRSFLIRPLGGGHSIDLRPAGGDLLVMRGRAQHDWEHGVPKRRQAGPRISLSWRWAPGLSAPGTDRRLVTMRARSPASPS